ncbi:MAG: hypothetical protein J7647_15620 [Cyanobacteria bacterium SBLK]|nr:hypothetical protein [Cyanobacteria bacterium SBLK]
MTDEQHDPEDEQRDSEDEQHDSDFENWAKKCKLNLNSPTTSQLYEYRMLTVQEYISRFRRGNIKAVLPNTAKSMTVEEALRQGKVEKVDIRKLMIQKRKKFQK